MTEFRDYLDECLSDPQFKMIWEHIKTGMLPSDRETDRPAMRIRFYEKSGVCPAKDILESIPDRSDKAAVIGGIYEQLLHDYNGIKPFCSRYALDGISELRINTADSGLVLFFFPFGTQIIIVNGYNCRNDFNRESTLEEAVSTENSYLTQAVNG